MAFVARGGEAMRENPRNGSEGSSARRRTQGWMRTWSCRNCPNASRGAEWGSSYTRGRCGIPMRRPRVQTPDRRVRIEARVKTGDGRGGVYGGRKQIVVPRPSPSADCGQEWKTKKMRPWLPARSRLPLPAQPASIPAMCLRLGGRYRRNARGTGSACRKHSWAWSTIQWNRTPTTIFCCRRSMPG